MTGSSDIKRVEGTLALEEVLRPFLARNVNPHHVAKLIRVQLADRGFAIGWHGTPKRKRPGDRTNAGAHAAPS